MRQWTTAKVGETGLVISERPDTDDRFLVSTIASAQSPEALAMLLPAMRTVFMHNICRWREYRLAPVLRAMVKDCKGRTRELSPDDVYHIHVNHGTFSRQNASAARRTFTEVIGEQNFFSTNIDGLSKIITGIITDRPEASVEIPVANEPPLPPQPASGKIAWA